MRIFSLAATCLLLTVSVNAQHWTSEEQEIIDLNQKCWDAWASEDLDAVQRICNHQPDARGWWTPDAAPEIGWFEKNAERWGAWFHPRDTWLYWDIRPLSVKIFNETALIHFWAMHTHEDSKGNRTTQTEKRLNIWQRIDDKWSWIGGMAMPEGDRVW
jgi:hypothetical protein